MDYLVPKAPGDTVAYFVDWSNQLEQSDSISTFTLTVTSGTVTIAQPQDNFGTFLRMLVSGGADGETAIINCAITTANGLALSRNIQLAVVASAESVTPSTCTKQLIVAMAFEELTLAGYEFDVTNEENASALRRLDTLMARWRTEGLDLGYNFPLSLGQSLLTDASGLPDDTIDAVALSLAKRIAAPIGKSLSAESQVALNDAVSALYARYLTIPERQLAWGTPRGAGRKPYGTWWPYGTGVVVP